MKSETKKPRFFAGEIYFVEYLNLSTKIDFKKEFEKVEYTDNWKVDRGNIVPNIGNEKLKFDIIPASDFYGCFFTGFLYSDGKVLGKVKYVQEANESDVVINGQYKKLNRSRILMYGTWENANGSKEYFWVELIRI